MIFLSDPPSLSLLETLIAVSGKDLAEVRGLIAHASSAQLQSFI